jgi:hypothetical protein
MRHLTALAPVVCVFAALASTAAATPTPHAKAMSLLLTCKRAIASVPIVALTANTPQVPRANRRAHAAYIKCGDDGPWLKLKSDKAVHDAYGAWVDLALGIGDYQTYCTNVAFEHTGTGILHRAQREIRQGRREAKHALSELS